MYVSKVCETCEWVMKLYFDSFRRLLLDTYVVQPFSNHRNMGVRTSRKCVFILPLFVLLPSNTRRVDSEVTLCLGTSLFVCLSVCEMSPDVSQEKRCCSMEPLVMEATVLLAAEAVYSGQGVHPYPLINMVERSMRGTIGHQVPDPAMTGK